MSRKSEDTMGILICGLNGVGKSTLGKALADRLEYQFIDNEDLFFPKTDSSQQRDQRRTKEHSSIEAIPGGYDQMTRPVTIIRA